MNLVGPDQTLTYVPCLSLADPAGPLVHPQEDSLHRLRLCDDVQVLIFSRQRGICLGDVGIVKAYRFLYSLFAMSSLIA